MTERINLDFAQQLADSAQLSSTFNSESGELPFGYFEPTTDGKVYWICGKDRNEKITSIFSYNGPDGTERKISYLKNLEEAKYHRDELILNGWKPIENPKMKMYHNGQEVIMNRKQKKRLAKKVAKVIAEDPVMNSDMLEN